MKSEKREFFQVGRCSGKCIGKGKERKNGRETERERERERDNPIFNASICSVSLPMLTPF